VKPASKAAFKAASKAPEKRPYTLGLRLTRSDERRTAILSAAIHRLESGPISGFTLETVAASAEVTRQTVYNLFGTRSGLLEALFDHIALEAGLARMPEVMQRSDPRAMLDGVLEIFTGFWSRHRTLLRRIHGMAALDPEFGKAVAARNERRRAASGRVVQQFARSGNGALPPHAAAALFALTSFEFFDSAAEAAGSEQAASELVRSLVHGALSASPKSESV